VGKELLHPFPSGGGRKWEVFLPYILLYHKREGIATKISKRGSVDAELGGIVEK